MNLSPAIQAGLFRFVGALIALGVAVAIIVYVPNDTLKVTAAALAGAAILAIEEGLKTATTPPSQVAAPPPPKPPTP